MLNHFKLIHIPFFNIIFFLNIIDSMDIPQLGACYSRLFIKYNSLDNCFCFNRYCPLEVIFKYYSKEIPKCSEHLENIYESIYQILFTMLPQRCSHNV